MIALTERKRMAGRLEGKVVIVTGAGAGIGESAVLRFIQEGARVVAVDRSAGALKKLRRRADATALHTVEADVATSPGTSRMVAEAVERFGRLDGLFNNAGIVPQGTIEETSEEEWDLQMAVNVKSVFLGCKAALPEFRRAGGGSIVSTASAAGLVGVKSRAAYSASKAAIMGLSRSMALDYAGEGIRVNCVCPGTVDTPSWRERVSSASDPEEALRMFISRQPMGRVGRPEEVASAALYLLSDEAVFVTGTCLIIDGGWSA